MTVLPVFQPQNPTLNGFYLGWSSCTSYAFAMAANYDRQYFVMNGQQLRRKTGDLSGGTTLAQNDWAAREGWGVDLDTNYRYPWANFASRINAGQAAVLQGWYGPIADSRFDAGRGFRGNHAVLVLPGWIVMDSLADGRYGDAYQYHGESYPQSLLKTFGGKLNVSTSEYRALGSGLVYASFTRDRVANYKASVRSGTYGVYSIGPDGQIASSRVATTGGFSATCTAPRLYLWPSHTAQSLVRLTSGSHSGQYIRSTWSRVA